MPAGARIWDGSHALKLDISHRIGQILGIVDTGTIGGYVEDDAFAAGTPFWTCYVLDSVTNVIQPNITVAEVSGHWRLTWSWPSGSIPANNRIIYGVF